MKIYMNMTSRKVLSVLAGLFLMIAFSACNTVEGVGKDIKKGGEVIEKAAERAKS